MARPAQAQETQSISNVSAPFPIDMEPSEAALHPLTFCFHMQSTLELYQLMKIFHAHLKQSISYQSFHFSHHPSGHKFEIGREQAFTAKYELKIDGDYLGEFSIGKSVAFSKTEVETLENILSYLLLPLRNAIRYEKAVKCSMTDPLTSLFNRQAFDVTLKREIDLTKRHHAHLSLLVIDIDFFKQINDTYGHQAGDQVLMSFAGHLGKIHRQSDMIFRYGGEEFALILPNTNLDGAVEVAERICKSTAAEPIIIDDQNITMTISIGAAAYLDAENSKRFFSRADGALYTAKLKGRNQVCVS